MTTKQLKQGLYDIQWEVWAICEGKRQTSEFEEVNNLIYSSWLTCNKPEKNKGLRGDLEKLSKLLVNLICRRATFGNWVDIDKRLHRMINKASEMNEDHTQNFLNN